MIIHASLKTDHFEELKQRLLELQRQRVSVGVFDNSKHYSGFTYVNLFTYLSRGDRANNLVPRDTLLIAFEFNPFPKQRIRKKLVTYFKGINSKKGRRQAEVVMKDVGKYYRDKAADVFGKSPPLAANTPWTETYKENLGFDPTKPLMMTGDLRKKIAFKIENNVWEYGR
ncbi:hypothetical protein [Vibrio phage RYC]|nr:hypothetical protein [Vibrio phage RYC]